MTEWIFRIGELIAAARINHYHVVAVQDLGGSQEYWRSWGCCTERITADDGAPSELDAKALVVEIVACDTVSNHFAGTDVFDAVIEKLGDKFFDLSSTNVGPTGWNQIWIVGCRSDDTFDRAGKLTPVWTGEIGSFNWDGIDRES
jgi:hypothetical protein